VYRVLHHHAKKEMKAYIRSHYLQDEGVTEFTQEQAASFHWIDEHEFSWNGDMYDVVRTGQKENGAVLHAVKDEREKELIAAFLDLRTLLEDTDEEDERNVPLKQWLKKHKKEMRTQADISFRHFLPVPLPDAFVWAESITAGYAKTIFPPPKG
jgi:hypothetical protein